MELRKKMVPIGIEDFEEFRTGNLEQRGEADGRRLNLAIPNLEVREISSRQILECFTEAVRKDGDTLGRFCGALLDGVTRIKENRL